MTQVIGDIAAIAAGLSEAQRIGVSTGYAGSLVTARRLATAKLVRFYARRTGEIGAVMDLTPLGLAVRAYLEGERK